MLSKRINQINSLIFKNIHLEGNNGLLNGKMGIAIYLYHEGRAFKDEKCTILANELVDQVYDAVGQDSIKTDYENGLAGIAWSIEYLAQKEFLNADTDEILRDVDDKILQQLANFPFKAIELTHGLLGYGFLLLSRLFGKDITNLNDHDRLLKRMLISVINSMYVILEENEEVLKEPMHFSCIWNLPLLLNFLAQVKTLEIYNYKIDIIINRLSIIVMGILPINYGNRILLMVSLEHVMRQFDFRQIEEYYKLLHHGLENVNYLPEFSNKNILAREGMTGLSFFLWFTSLNWEQYNFGDFSSRICTKIMQSEFWDELDRKEKIQTGHLGLLSGLSGIGLGLLNSIDQASSTR